MAVDVKEFIEKISMKELDEDLSQIKDVIEVLSEEKVLSTSDMTIVRQIGKDGSVVTTADKYGNFASTYTANYEDRTYLKDQYTFPEFDGINITIPLTRLHLFGLTRNMLKDGATITNKQLMGIGEKLMPEIKKLIRKMRQKRRDQVRELLSNLQAPTQDSQKPLGLAPVSTARTTAWAYTNQLALDLTVDNFKTAVDIFAGSQKTVNNEEYMISNPIMLMHASSYTKAEEIMLPNLSVNVLNRTPGDSILPERLNIKATGVYGDTANPNDWILLGENHKIYRLAFVTPVSERTDGTFVVVEWIPASGNADQTGKKNSGLSITLYDKSIMVCDSALDIVKSVAP